MGMIRAILGGINLQGWVGVIVGATLAALLALQTGKTHHWHKAADRFEMLFTKEQSAHRQTVINYQTAAEQARKADLANKQRAEAEQVQLRERTKADYEDRIARARADAQRLRNIAEGRAAPGGPGTATVSDPHRAGPAAPGTTQDHGLSLDERLIATEQAIQLDALIDYVEGLLKVDMNGARQQPPARPRP